MGFLQEPNLMNDLRRFSLRRYRYNLGCFPAVNFIKAISEMTCKLKVTITLSTSEITTQNSQYILTVRIARPTSKVVLI